MSSEDIYGHSLPTTLTSQDTHSQPSKVKQRVIIGIDFGTTYSGVAWADSTKPREIFLVRQWPDAKGKQDMDKVPSVMQYDSKLKDHGCIWGYQTSTDTIRQGNKVLEYLKLLLDPSQERDSILPDPLGLAEIQKRIPFPNKPVDAVADYLRELKQHALKVLSAQYGKEFWKVIPTEYHLTIPAVWSESAKALTLEAAKEAGIGMSQELVLISEPEAAALYCLDDMKLDFLKKGDTFMIADCGGGTVDLVSYKILERIPKLQVKEIAVDGGLCGSIFLNRQFEVFLKDRLGQTTIDKMKQKGKPYWKMVEEFDGKLKHKFDGSEDQEVMDCPVPGLRNSQAQRIEDGYMEIDREEMEGIFNPVINEILRLIQHQIDSVIKDGHKPISTIILVGGFGSSPYLCKRVKDHIRTKNNSDEVTVLQPPNAWSAVARGAVVCGLQTVEVESRRARRSYGVKYQTIYDPSNPIHAGANRVWDPVRQTHACINLMRWYVQKGDEVRGKKKISFPFFRTYWEWDLSLESTLIASISLFGSNSPRSQLEPYNTHENVFTICTLNCDLNPLRKHLVQMTNLSGEVYFTLNFSIVMYIHSAQLLFGVEYMGEPCGVLTTVTFY